MQWQAWCVVVAMAASGAVFAAGAAPVAASGGVAAAGGGNDPAQNFVWWQAERAAEKERIGSLVERQVLDGAAYERAGDSDRFARVCDTGVLIPVEGLRALN